MGKKKRRIKKVKIKYVTSNESKASYGAGNCKNMETKTCQNCNNEFVIEKEDFNFYEKIKVPSPTFCPECRMQRRMAFRNERSLYKDTCDLCGNNIISLYSPDKSFIVYCQDCWYSDKWDSMQFSQDYDSQKPFFTQFRELMEKVPRIALVQLSTNLNCNYANYIADGKNVYLSQSVTDSENVFYSYGIDKSFDIFDCLQARGCSQCYENVDCSRNSRSKFLFQCRECIDSAFLFDCVNCQDCFMSRGLRNKRYMVRNVQFSKEEYEVRMKEVGMNNFQSLIGLRKEFLLLIKNGIHRFANLIKTTECTGDSIMNAKNVQNSFYINSGENLKFCVRTTLYMKDTYDATGGVTGELIYEAVVAGHEGYHLKFSSNSDTLREVEYSDWCKNSSHLFGCIGLRSKEYCILNKQYSKESFDKLKIKIIDDMNSHPYIDAKGNKYQYGEFFPTELSPFTYNESMAYEHIPLSQSETLAQGFSWRNPDPSSYVPTITAGRLPESIGDVLGPIVKEIIACSLCLRVYRILETELKFLKQYNIALPQKCQECRHKDRFNMQNPLKLWHRRCMKKGCENEFETTYAPDRPEIVYCEKCYQQEVY